MMGRISTDTNNNNYQHFKNNDFKNIANVEMNRLDTLGNNRIDYEDNVINTNKPFVSNKTENNDDRM